MPIDVLRKEQVSHIDVQPNEAAPVVSLFMPFDPKMVSKTELAYKQQSLVNEAERKLVRDFSFAVAQPVLDNLKLMIKNLDYSTHKSSVAIYASAKGGKVFYLDTPLEEKVIVETSFNIRLLAESKKKQRHYLVLVLGSNVSKVFFGNGEQLVSMLTNTRKKSIDNDTPALENFLKQTDNNLNIILNYFPTLPVFVLGNACTLNKYKIITKNESHINQLIEIYSDDVVIKEILNALQPYVQNWDYIQMKHLHRRLDNAMDNGKIAVGIDNVAKAAKQRKAKLLVLEKGYTFPVVKAAPATDLSAGDMPLTDAVDEVIERVLSYGGEVAFADKKVMEDYQHIALIY